MSWRGLENVGRLKGRSGKRRGDLWNPPRGPRSSAKDKSHKPNPPPPGGITRRPQP